MQLTIALAAEEAAGVQALRLLAQRGHRVAAVFTDSGEGESSASVAGVARSLGAPVHAAADVRVSALADHLREQRVDLLLSVHSRHLVHANALEAPPLGAYNLHPGPLPEFAGLNIPSWALYEGAERHGVTLHRMTPVYDEGPIAFVDSFELQASDTGLSVLMQCVRRGMRLVERLLERLEQGEPVPAQPQEASRRRWFGAGPPAGGLIDWRWPARRAVDFARACDYRPFDSPWGFPRCAAQGMEIAILGASVGHGHVHVDPGTVANAGNGDVLIAAADAWVRVEQVEVAGRRLPAADVLRGGESLAPLDGDPDDRLVS
jgi:methionyl-tRNA formyltransferase